MKNRAKSNKSKGEVQNESSSGVKVSLKTIIYTRDSDIRANEEIIYFFPTRRTHWTLHIN